MAQYHNSSVPKCSPKASARPLAHYQPDFWGDIFLNYTPPPQDIQLQRKHEHDKLKEEVREKLTTMGDHPKERIIFIDAIERLGVAHHFEQEIEALLQQFYEYNKHDELYEVDLNYASLRFRILRQHGLFTSCDVFEKFKGEDGNFKESMASDIHGMLNLYEASYLRVHGEKVLDEAMEFTTTQLKSLVGKLSGPLEKQVSQALKLPLHRSMPRLLCRYYIDIYEDIPSHDKTLLRFAKLDFNLLQLLYLEELQDISRWWKSLGVPKHLPFVRERIVESYLWGFGTLQEPQYALVRAINAKICQLLAIIDDLYDAYGLFEEFQPYNEAIQRWDRICKSKLPEYMELPYNILLNAFDGFEQDIAKQGRSCLVSYARDLMKAQCQAYFQEAKWLHERLIPMYDEYMEESAIATAGAPLMSATAFLGLGDIATKEAFDWVSQTPKPVKASSTIGRILNDIASRKIEKQRGRIASAVECFMRQHGVSEEKATKELYNKVEEAWKDLNEEMFRQPPRLPRPLLMVIVNLTRVVEEFYRLGVDEYSFVNENMRCKIRTLFIDSVIV